MGSGLQILAILATGGLFLIVLELVRQRRVMERYALLWLLSSTVLLMLAVWNGLLERIAWAVGIATPSNALFLVAFGFILVLLLHFSTVTSGLTDQNKVLAQRLAVLQQRLALLQQRLAELQKQTGAEPKAPSAEIARERDQREPELIRQR
jgi:hypothetical protein